MMTRAVFALALLAPATIAGQDPRQGAPRPARPELLPITRPVLPTAVGPNRLDVDVPLLAGGATFSVSRTGASEYAVATGGLSDLRFYERSGREVPYLLVDAPTTEPRWSGSVLLPVARTDTTSGFEADLSELRTVDRVRVDLPSAPYLKRVRLEGSGDRQRWTLLVDEGTLFDLPAERLRQTVLEFAPGDYRYLRIIWDDKSSGRVPLPDAVFARNVTPRAAAPTLRAPLAFERRTSEPRVSRYRLRLPGARLPIVALELTVGGGNVLRAARVTEQRLAGGQLTPFPLGTATLRRAVRGDVAASSLRIPIAQPNESVLDLVVDDGDNPPLEITGVTAEFAALPYIYFEASTVEPLIARYGGERIAPPSYDLEALRERVATIEQARAGWGAPLAAPAAAVASVEIPAMRGGPLDVTPFRYQRSIPEGPNGLTAVALDAAVLAHSSFDDLRIATGDGLQVPYLYETLDEPLTLNLGQLEPASRLPSTADRRSRYAVTLPFPSLPMPRLVLTTSARVFQRRVSIEIPRPAGAGQREPWLQEVHSVSWTHADPDTPAPPLSINLARLDVTDIVVAVDEGDNSPLPLGTASLLLPAYRVRFVRTGPEPLTLVYGQPRLGRPFYDIALLAPRLLGAPATELSVGPERGVEAPKPNALPKTLFWVMLGVAVAAMLALIARLVVKGGPSNPDPIVAEAEKTAA